MTRPSSSKYYGQDVQSVTITAQLLFASIAVLCSVFMVVYHARTHIKKKRVAAIGADTFADAEFTAWLDKFDLSDLTDALAGVLGRDAQLRIVLDAVDSDLEELFKELKASFVTRCKLRRAINEQRDMSA